MLLILVKSKSETGLFQGEITFFGTYSELQTMKLQADGSFYNSFDHSNDYGILRLSDGDNNEKETNIIFNGLRRQLSETFASFRSDKRSSYYSTLQSPRQLEDLVTDGMIFSSFSLVREHCIDDYSFVNEKSVQGSLILPNEKNVREHYFLYNYLDAKFSIYSKSTGYFSTYCHDFVT